MDPFEEADRANEAARQRHERERFERERAMRRGPQAPPDDLPLFNPTQRGAQDLLAQACGDLLTLDAANAMIERAFAAGDDALSDALGRIIHDLSEPSAPAQAMVGDWMIAAEAMDD